MIIGNFTSNEAQDTYTGELDPRSRRPQSDVPADRSEDRQGAPLPGRQCDKDRRCRVWRRVEEAQRGGVTP
jgi:hypothetical protein